VLSLNENERMTDQVPLPVQVLVLEVLALELSPRSKRAVISNLAPASAKNQFMPPRSRPSSKQQKKKKKMPLEPMEIQSSSAPSSSISPAEKHERRKKLGLLCLALLALIFFVSRSKNAASSSPATSPSTPIAPTPAAPTTTIKLGYSLISKHPHDPMSFTQGLVYDLPSKKLYESGGLYKVRRRYFTREGQEKERAECASGTSTNLS